MHACGWNVYQPGARSAAGWFYNYFVFVCLLVRPCISGGVNGVAAGTYGWFELVGFVRLCAAKGGQTMPVLSTAEAQLSLHKQSISRKQPQKHETDKKSAANYEPAKVRKLYCCYSTLCPISELHDPVLLQCQPVHQYHTIMW